MVPSVRQKEKRTPWNGSSDQYILALVGQVGNRKPRRSRGFQTHPLPRVARSARQRASPIRSNAVVVVDPLLVFAVPSGLVVLGEDWSAFKLLA